MNSTVKILIGTAIVAGVATLGVKGASLYNKVKQAAGNINFSVSFLRIHGLIGEGLTKFISPTIRVLFNLNLSNFSGFDIDVKKIYARIEANKAGTNSWDVIAKTNSYLDIALVDGKESNKTLTIDFKGLSTVTSLTNKGNRHRVVLTYNFKGQQLDYTSDLDLTGPISTYWAKAKNSINSLKGAGPAKSNLHLLA